MSNFEGTPTPGPWVVKFRPDGSSYISMGNPMQGQHKQFDLMLRAGESNDEADAALIGEAGTVLHETGLTPRQLAEQRAELFNALTAACSQVDAIGGESAVYRRILDRNSTTDDIANATQRKEPGA